MGFKVEIEIFGYEEKHCGNCNIDEKVWVNFCPIFDEDREYDDKQSDFIRCPECLEAEKQYKEKENA